MNEIARVARLAGVEQDFSGLEAAFFATERDELHRLARHEIERPRAGEPCDVALERHFERLPVAAPATSLYPPASVTRSCASAGLSSIFCLRR